MFIEKVWSLANDNDKVHIIDYMLIISMLCLSISLKICCYFINCFPCYADFKIIIDLLE